MYTEFNYKYMCIIEILKTNIISLNEFGSRIEKTLSEERI